MERNSILLAADDAVERRNLIHDLGDRYRVVEAATCSQARSRFEAERPDAAILEYRLVDCDGLALLEDLRILDPDLPVVLLTADSSIELSVEAMRRGAHHLITKPADPLFEYDSSGRQTARVFPGGARETMVYNADGTLARHTDFNGAAGPRPGPAGRRTAGRDRAGCRPGTGASARARRSPRLRRSRRWRR